MIHDPLPSVEREEVAPPPDLPEIGAVPLEARLIAIIVVLSMLGGLYAFAKL